VRRLGIFVPWEYPRVLKITVIPKHIAETIVKFPQTITSDEYYEEDS